MPFARPTLSELRTRVAQQIAAGLPAGADPLLRFSNLRIMGEAQAGLAHLHYGYLDWIARQAIPYTATDEFLEYWAALKGVIRVPAAQASGVVTFTGTNGTLIPTGTAVVRGDGTAYTSTADATVASGTADVSVLADADPEGLTGAFGNCEVGTVLTLSAAIAGVSSSGSVSTACTGGADIEDDEALRARMLFAYQHPSQGGAWSDYLEWALAVPGVTRAWVAPNGYDTGTVVVYTMFDVAEAAYGGFPQGTDGVSQYDRGYDGTPRDTEATGDQLAVADAIWQIQPVTALVYSVAPIADTIDFTISGISGASATVKAAIEAAIASVLLLYGGVGDAVGITGEVAGTVYLSYVEAAIAAVPGSAGFVIDSPTGNIVSATGEIPVLGTVSFV